MSVINDRPRDCVSCRTIGAMGMVGAGGYIYYFARKRKEFSYRLAMSAIAIICTSLGINRYMDWPPFGDPPFSRKTNVERKNGNVATNVND